MACGVPGFPGARRKTPLGRLPPRPLVRSRRALAARGVVIAWVLVAVAAPVIAPHPPLVQDLPQRLSPPSAGHWLGTDPLWRDNLSPIVSGALLCIPLGVAAVVLAAFRRIVVGNAADAT